MRVLYRADIEGTELLSPGPNGRGFVQHGHEVAVSTRKVVCIVVSSVETAEAFLLGHIEAMTESYDVCLVANCNEEDRLRRRGVQTDVLYVPILRNVSPLNDILCVLRLFRLFRRRRFDVIHSVTPKAGLLGMLAGKLAGVPIRIHTFTGQVWATRTGLSRKILKGLDMLLAACATNILVDSQSQMEFLCRQGVVSPLKATVLANGSISGVDINRFKPDCAARKSIRRDLAIPEQSCVFLFVGRLNLDKGVLVLAKAFSEVARSHPNVYLLVVGPDEAGMKPRMEELCGDALPRVRFVSFTKRPEAYMAAANVLCLPSRREGFGSVVIEAAAIGIPAIASRIYGLTDAIDDEVTGLLHSPDDSSALAQAMHRLAESPDLVHVLSEAARERALQRFGSEIVTGALQAYYKNILSLKSSA